MKRMATVGIVGTFVLCVIAPAAAGGGGHYCMSEFSDATTTEVDIEASCFSPTVIRIEPGATVKWTNREGVPHTVSGASEIWGGYRDLGRGDSVSYRFTDTGVFPYYCAYHPSMVGAVVVGDGSAAGSEIVPMGEDQMPLGSSDKQAPVAPSRAPLWGLGVGAVALLGLVTLIGRRAVGRTRLHGSQAG